MAARWQYADLSDEQIDRLTRDIDDSLCDIELVTRPRTEPANLMYERLRCLGVEPRDIAAAEPGLIPELEARCETCASWRRCARELARAQGHSDRMDYCPNSARIDRLALARRGHAHPED
jgi:hypothetical protein